MSATAEPTVVQLFATLVTVQHDVLLLPNLAMLEVVAADSLRPEPDAPDWFAGHLPQDGGDVPVARFERLNSTGVEPAGRRTRVAIISAISGRLPRRRFGLVCEGHPLLVTLNRGVMQGVPLNPGDQTQLVLARVRMAAQAAAIPDLEYIEGRIARLLADIAGRKA